jgi:hypothetical protein
MNKKISKELEGIIAQMLKPLKGLSLEVVIEGLSGHKARPFDKSNSKDKKVLIVLKKVAEDVLREVNKKGILRPRPNEVGNDIEPFVKNALNKYNYKADTPKTISGKKKSTGYPDIEFIDEFKRHNYLECKTYNIENIDTTQRSFYLSPSDDFKVTKDAYHFGISFEIFVVKSIKDKHLYKVKSWKILDLSKLELDVKYEFNSDNKRLYDKEIILAEKK